MDKLKRVNIVKLLWAKWCKTLLGCHNRIINFAAGRITPGWSLFSYDVTTCHVWYLTHPYRIFKYSIQYSVEYSKTKIFNSCPDSEWETAPTSHNLDWCSKSLHIHAILKSSKLPPDPLTNKTEQKNHADISNLQQAQHPSAMPRAMFLVLLFMLFTNRTFLCFPTEPHAQKLQQPQCNLTPTQNLSSNTSAGTLTAEPRSAMQRHEVIPTFTYT